MLEVERDNTGNGKLVLHLKGDVTIETVALLREELLNGLNEANHLVLDGQAVDSIDFFGMQLLCSAHRTSIAWMKLLTWQNSEKTAIDKTVIQTGFSRNHGCSLCPEDIDCMWLCGAAEL